MDVTLTRGLVTQIDDEFEFLDQHKWYALKVRSKANFRYYAVRTICLNGTPSTNYMHRVIMETKLGRPLLKTEQIDHINHDGLKNTFGNLRLSTNQQNSMNSRKQNINAYSQFKGVTWHKNRSKWQAQIRKDGKEIYLGIFTTENKAAHAVDAAAKELFGPYANLNFPEA
jgi:hypothetical protein